MKYIITFIILNLTFAQFSLELIAGEFDKPVYVTSDSYRENLIYVVEQEGTIWMIDYIKENEFLFLDISDRVHKPLFPGDEMGLLGFTLDPEYSENGYIYVNYNDKDDNTIISRFTSYHNNVNINTEKIIMKFKQPYSNHNGGFIQFDSEGYFYISVGDGGSAGDPDNRAQNLSNIFGTILRILINEDGSYTIPEDNPFYGEKKIRQEIWVYGLRNVWRFSFDGLNGDMYMGDVGQNSWEEINYYKKGTLSGINYGWNIMEAFHCFPEDSNCITKNLQVPIFEYPNDAKYVKTLFGINQKDMHGCSITGGYVYRGSKIPEFYSRYFFGDYCTGKIWSFIYKNGKAEDLKDHTNELLSSLNIKKFYLSSFGEMYDGELMLVDYSGYIYKLIK